MRPALLALFIAVLVAACGDSNPGVDETPTSVVTIVVPTPTFDPGEAILPTVALSTPTATPELSDFESGLKEIESRIIAARMLFSLRPVAKEFISREELTDHLVRKLDEERQELARKGQLYKVMGIIESDVDLYDLYLGLYQEGVLGFFEGEENKLYVVQDQQALRAEDKVTYAHEFAHALQQQHFNIQSEFDVRQQLSSDRQLAYSALVEGDATLSQAVYMFQYLTEAERQSIQTDAGVDLQAFLSAPHVVQRTFNFPYIEGTQFQIEGWDTINLAFRDPPDSTEQILHPSKFVVREQPVELFMPDAVSALGSGWTLTDSDTLGEFFLMAYLEDGMPAQAAANAAAGWGGDGYHLISGPGGQQVLVMRTAWDTNADTTEFGEAFRGFTQARLGGEWEGVPGRPGSAILHTEEFTVMTYQEVFEVRIVFAPSAEILDTVVDALNAVLQAAS